MTAPSSSSTEAVDPKDRIAIFKECLEAHTPSSSASATSSSGSPGLYQDDAEIDACRRLVEALDDDLVSHAAHTSYAYWYLANHNETADLDVPVPTAEQRVNAAMREARRHYVHTNRDFDRALKSLTESCQYRKKENLDLLRTCFDTTHVYLNEEDEARARQMAEWIRADMELQYHILRGTDGKGQAVMIKYPRTAAGATQEAYVMAQIYMAERSTAATEFLTRGRHERSVAVYNYVGFDRSMSPPFAMQVAAATQIQKIFPERLQTLVMVEPPFWLRGVMSLLTPFLSESITQRIQWASGEDEREEVFSSEVLTVDPADATILLRREAQLTSAVSLDHFLVDLPFCYVYDMMPCKRDVSDAELELDMVAHTVPKATRSFTEQASNLWGSLSGSFGGEEEKK